MTVKIIPISPDYRENWERVFGKIPPTPLIAPDGTGSASSAPRGDAKIYMTTPLPASWGMVDGRPF
jgi:hypothetical protein